MPHHLSTRIHIKSFITFLFGITLIISCGGGGGGGGGSSSASDPGSPSAPTFTITTIDSTGDVGWNSSIALGSIHISYYDNTNGYLKYAYYNGSSWSTGIVDSSADVGYYSSIAVQSDGTVHISYYDYDSGSLKYATCSGAADCTQSANWNNGIVVDDSSDVGYYSSIAVESDGTVHIGYYDYLIGSLKYATCSGASDCTDKGNWHNVTIANMGASIGIDPEVISLVIDSSRNVHIVYYDSISFSLKHVSGTYDSFNAPGYDPDNDPETVDDSGDVGTGLSLAIDTSDNLHISYYDTTNFCLKYAVGTSGSFDIETIDSTSDVGMFSSIAVETDGTVHIAYYDFTNEHLKYAYGTSGSFNTIIVDDSTSVGEFPSIAVEPDGTVHISYYDYIDLSSGHLKYAVK